MNILICNVGSTSLKYQLFDMDNGENVLCAGGAERVGQAKSLFYHKFQGESINLVLNAITDYEGISLTKVAECKMAVKDFYAPQF